MAPPNDDRPGAYRRTAASNGSVPDLITFSPKATLQAKADPTGASQKKKVVASAPYAEAFEKAPFTLKQVRDLIPNHCFERSLVTSGYYVARDVVLTAALYYAASRINELPGPAWVQSVAWLCYWITQGTLGFGVWVLGHEGGHSALSEYPIVNNTVGYILHSYLLTPYYSWKFSHSKHHKTCGNMDKDTVFVPHTRSFFPHLPAHPAENPHTSHHDESLWDDTPIYQFLVDIVAVTIIGIVGWPLYLWFNYMGQDHKTWTSHFLPTAPIFEARQRGRVVLSDIGCIITAAILAYWGTQTSFATVFKYYLAPFLVTNAWLVVITFLHHTDIKAPHYRTAEWSFLHGALATIDRDYGFIVNNLQHHIGNTHVVHHLFSTMPHYHQWEATEAIKPLLGKHYLRDDRNVAVAMWESYRKCKFVEDTGGVLFFKH